MSRRGSAPFSALVALLLFVGSAAAIMASQSDIGIARDEATYMHHGSRYATWWLDLAEGKPGQLSASAITQSFGGPRATDGNREHPPLMKTLMGLSHHYLHQELQLVAPVTAYRLPSALMFGLLVALVYLYARRHFGGVVAGVAAILVAATPRLFFHAHLATFDVAVVTLWFATLFVYDRCLHSRAQVVTLGLVFGLALATKHNALMLPAVIGLHYAWVVHRDVSGYRGRWPGRVLAYARGLWNLKPSVAVALIVGGPLVLVAVWPWLWLDPLTHVREWIAFHAGHVHYNYEYLGDNLNAPPFPWHIAPVTVALTMPVVTLVAAAFGAGDMIQRYRHDEHAEDAPAMLLFLSAAVAVGPFLLPSTPVFGAEKHFAAVVPSLCIFAGLGVKAAGETVGRALALGGPAARALSTGLAGLVFLAALAETRSAHPYALSHYNALAGGPAGGADLGMNRQFWGVSAIGVLAEVRGRGDGDAWVYTHDASPAWPWYQKEQRVDPQIRDAGAESQGIARSSLAFVIHEKHFARHDILIWRAYGTTRPVYVLTFDGVPLVSLYQRPTKSTRP